MYAQYTSAPCALQMSLRLAGVVLAPHALYLRLRLLGWLRVPFTGGEWPYGSNR